MRYRRSKAQEGYVKGLMDASAKGYAASQDPNFTERHNPYKRAEHQQSWLDGFRRGRAAAKEKSSK